MAKLKICVRGLAKERAQFLIKMPRMLSGVAFKDGFEFLIAL